MFLILLFISCSNHIASNPSNDLLTKDDAISKWISIDLHVHSSLGSNDTDGWGTPENILDAMTQAHLDFVWLTDHSNSLGSMHCEDVEDCPNEGPELIPGQWPQNVFRGVEISPRHENPLESTGHIGCLPRIEEEFDQVTFIDRPFGTVSGRDVLEQCKNANGFRILNHPFGPAPWVAFDWTSTDFEAIEIYNGSGGFDNSDMLALDFWEQSIVDTLQNDREATSFYIPIASSDSHRWSTVAPGSVLDPALGWPRTYIGIPEQVEQNFDSNKIISLIEDGHLFIGDPSTKLSYSIQNSITSEVVPVGGTILKHEKNEIVVEAVSDDDVILEIRFLEEETHEFETVFTSAVTNDPQEFHMIIEESGIVYVRVVPTDFIIGARGFAMGQFIRIQD